jgi:hypothetical protein
MFQLRNSRMLAGRSKYVSYDPRILRGTRPFPLSPSMPMQPSKWLFHLHLSYEVTVALVRLAVWVIPLFIVG